MLSLIDHMKNTINIFDGYTVGTIVIQNRQPFLQLEIGEMIRLNDDFTIEIKNGDEYERVTTNDILNTFTVEGWHLFAGFNARIKQ